MKRKRRVGGEDQYEEKGSEGKIKERGLIGWLAEQPQSRLSPALPDSPQLGGEIPKLTPHVQWIPFHRDPWSSDPNTTC
jgi:hypothetical protein